MPLTALKAKDKVMVYVSVVKLHGYINGEVRGFIAWVIRGASAVPRYWICGLYPKKFFFKFTSKTRFVYFDRLNWAY